MLKIRFVLLIVVALATIIAPMAPLTATAQSVCANNLLANPGFEEGSRKTEGLGTSLSSSVGDGWLPWAIRGDQVRNREPEFKVEYARPEFTPYRVHSGSFSQ